LWENAVFPPIIELKSTYRKIASLYF